MAITKAIEQKVIDRIHDAAALSTATLADRATSVRLNSAGARSASAWMIQHPSTQLFTISNDDYALAIRHRLGLFPTADDVNKLHVSCKLCGKKILRYDHYHTCVPLRGSVGTDRHHHVLHAVGSLAREAGCSFWAEPHLFDDYRSTHTSKGVRRRWREFKKKDNDNGIRPDAYIASRTQHYLIDVSVVNPTSHSYIKSDASLKYGTTEKREQDKIEKYKALAEQRGCEFIPFVLESYGAWGKEALTFLRTLSYSYSEDEKAQSSFYRHAVSTISIALQQGNAFISTLGNTRSHRPFTTTTTIQLSSSGLLPATRPIVQSSRPSTNTTNTNTSASNGNGNDSKSVPSSSRGSIMSVEVRPSIINTWRMDDVQQQRRTSVTFNANTIFSPLRSHSTTTTSTAAATTSNSVASVSSQSHPSQADSSQLELHLSPPAPVLTRCTECDETLEVGEEHKCQVVNLADTGIDSEPAAAAQSSESAASADTDIPVVADDDDDDGAASSSPAPSSDAEVIVVSDPAPEPPSDQ